MKYRFLELIKSIIFFIILITIIIFIDYPYFISIKNINNQFANDAKDLNLRYNSKLTFNETVLEYNKIKNKLIAYENAFLKEGEELNFIESLERSANANQLTQKIELDPNIQPLDEKIYKLDLRLNLSGNYYKLLEYLNELNNYKYKLVIKYSDLVNKGETADLTILASTYWLYDQTKKN